MKWFGCSAAAGAAAAWLVVTSFALPALAQRSANSTGITEVVPTGRAQPVTWRYTLDDPGAAWAAPGVNDGGWKAGPAPYGTAGTPAITVKTQWATPDVWMRREVTLPATGVDPAVLQLLVFHDEDVEIYFDGVLAAREGGFIRGYEPIEIQAA